MKRKSPIEITDKAKEQIKHLMSQNSSGAIGIRIGVKSGGCSGYSYSIEYAYNLSAFDEQVQLDFTKILIDKKAIMFLIESKMDYIQEEFKSGFTFINPREKSKCGCGKSFSV